MTARTLKSLCQDRAFKFGHFVVEFATLEDLERIYRAMTEPRAPADDGS